MLNGSARTLALAIVVSLGLSACANTTVNVTVVEQQGAVTGTGSLDASQNSGTMRVSFPTKTYQGPWTAVRTSGGGPNNASGIGMANLIAADGDHLRCEFRYSMLGMTHVTGIGLCRDGGGHTYDMQMAN
jgi:hypothetical protein